MTAEKLRMTKEDFPSDGTLHEQVTFILRFAIRAPSTHNTQPWLFHVEGNTVRIFLDEKRKLAQADPRGRDAHISIGCLLKNIEVAGKYFQMLEDLCIETKGGALASCTFVRSGGRDMAYQALFDAMLRRYNARGSLGPLPENTAEKLLTVRSPGAQALFISTANDLDTLGKLTASGIRAFHNKKAFRREFASWLRSNTSNERDGIHGYSVLMPLWASYALPWAIRFCNLGPFLGKKNAETIAAAPLACIIATEDDTQSAWIRAGQLSQELSLSAFANGGGASFFAAPIEHESSRNLLTKYFHMTNLPQFIIVFGTPQRRLPLTPRIPLGDRLIPQ